MLRYVVLYMSFLLFTPSVYSKNIDAQFSGFATLGATYSDSDDLKIRTDFLNNAHSGFTFKNNSNLGIQVNLDLATKWDAVGQIVLQDRINKNARDYIELAFIRYRPNRYWSLRAGRVNSDLYFLSEYQYVGYAYLWTQPPNEFYSPASSAANFDGVDIEYKNNLGDGFFKIRLAYGATRPELDNLGDEFTFSLKNVTALSTSYQVNNWLLRATHSQANLENLRSPTLAASISIFSQVPSSLWPASLEVLNDVDIAGKSTSYDALGLSYDGNIWLLQSEIGVSKNNWLPLSSSITAYTTLGYIQDNITYFVSLSGIKNRNKLISYDRPILDPSLPLELRTYIHSMSDGLNSILNARAARQVTISLGVRYDFAQNMALKFQVNHSNVSPKGNALWTITNADLQTIRHKVNTFALNLSVLF